MSLFLREKLRVLIQIRKSILYFYKYFISFFFFNFLSFPD